ATGPGPAAEGPEDLDVRVELLELAQLVEVAAQWVIPLIGHTVNALLGGEGLLVVGVGVAHGALAVLDVAERIQDVSQFLGRTGGDDVLDQVVALVDTPVGEVTHHVLTRIGRLRRVGRFLAVVTATVATAVVSTGVAVIAAVVSAAVVSAAVVAATLIGVARTQVGPDAPFASGAGLLAAGPP